MRANQPKEFINKPRPRPKPEQSRLRRSLNSSLDSLHRLSTEIQLNIKEVDDELINRKIGYMKQAQKDIETNRQFNELQNNQVEMFFERNSHA